jgi:hypothetical protein
MNLDEQDLNDDDLFLNSDMIPNGLQYIGIMNEAPSYYIIPTKSNMTYQDEKIKHQEYISKDDIYNFIKDLQNGLSIDNFLQNDDEVVSECSEEELPKEHLDEPIEEALEEEEIDLDDFYGNEE